MGGRSPGVARTQVTLTVTAPARETASRDPVPFRLGFSAPEAGDKDFLPQYVKLPTDREPVPAPVPAAGH